MKNQLITIEEQLLIIGGVDKKPVKPKHKPKKETNVTIGDGNKTVINILNFNF